jgi:putative spermidine/putrescine transport system permease protein
MSLPAHATAGQRALHHGMRLFTGLVVLFLIAPLVVIMPISLSAASSLSYPLPGLSLQWYEAIMVPYPWLTAFRNSLLVASVTTLIATVLGTLAAYGLHLASFPLKSLVVALLISPLVVPVVIVALVMYFSLASLGLLASFTGLVIAHTVLAVPFVVVTVSATLQGFDANLVRAAASLGARPLAAFRQVTLPLILPGVVSGAVFAFVTSFDEIVVALFIAGPGQFTLPRQLFAGLRDKLDPSIVAVSTLLILISAALLVVIELLAARAERLRATPRPG